MSILQDKTGHANIRHVILTFIILSGLAAAFLYYPPIPTRTAEELTQGDIKFIDSAGNPINGAIGISGSGISGGYKENVNFIKWERIPNGYIYFDAIGIKNVSVKFRLGRNSRNSNVIIENYGAILPKDLNEPVPGASVKYVQVSAFNLSFVEAEISIQYNASEIGDVDENSLSIYHYDSAAKEWSRLKTRVDPTNDILTAAVDSLSIFAVSAKLPGQIDIRDTRNAQVSSYIKTYDEARILIKGGKTSTLTVNEIPEKGELEVDARETKNVAVKLKIDKKSSGEIILDDYGKNNPVPSPLPGTPVKFVEIGAKGIYYSSAEVTIQYDESELEGADENLLVVYHWNGKSWTSLLTTLDAADNILTATTTSLSPFAVSTIGGAKTLRVSTNRYSVFAPFNTPTQVGYNADNSSFTFTAGALYLDDNGFPLANTDINFYIYNGTGVLKTSGTIATNSNGIAFFPYNTFTVFTSGTDTDYGIWTIRAEVASNANISGTARVNINATVRGCSRTVCHHTPDEVNADTKIPLTTSPISPYSDNFGLGSTKSMAYAAHVEKAATHGVSGSDSCNDCHTGLDRAPADTGVNAPWGAHKNLTCTTCHQNPTTWPITIPDCYSSGCHPRNNNNLTNTSTLLTMVNVTGASIYSTTNGSLVIPYSVHNGSQNSTTRGVPCWICHGPMHNITKPDPLPSNSNNITEYTQCISCHNAYQRHNSSVSCTVCHSQDVHAIKVFAQNATYVTGKTNLNRGNCTNCHQNSTFMPALLSKPRAGAYSGKIPQIQKPLNHSNDIDSGRKWNLTPGYWTPGDQISACRYCHGNTLHNNTGLGRPSLFKGNNTVNSTISSSSSWCASCHWQVYVSGGSSYTLTVNTYNFPLESLLVPPEITGNINYGNFTNASDGTPYVNHSNYSMDDSTCKGCHGSQTAGTTITGFQHNVGVGTLEGGPDCITCHNIGGGAGAGKLVNFSAMNDANAIHKGLNSGIVTGLSAENKKCWACHGTGLEPNGHPSNYRTPYKCEDCHIPGSGQNLNFSPQTILNVTQHYVNGSNVITASISSCYSCHNRTEMMVGSNLDPDGSGSIYSGSNGGNNSSSHYGKKRSDMMSWDSTTYCSYCHNTSSKNITFYVSDYNNSILNHSARSTTPLCTNSTCHSSGRLHNSTLKKPVSNDAYCSTCHGAGGSAATKNKVQHRTLFCTECHANSSSGTLAGKDIHAIKYLTKSNTFSTSKSNASDCVTCHQNSTVDSSLAGFAPFKILNPMHMNASNGSIWGSYWTTSQAACIYCHNDTLHSTVPLGRILQWSPNYVMYGDISTNSSCSDCHYKGDSNYTQMSSSFTSGGLLIPPEITNGTSWNGISANYSNHSSPFDDLSCYNCHGYLLSTGANMSEFVHNAASGISTEADAGIDNSSCITCHDINSNLSGHRINNSDMNRGVHANLNKNATNSTNVSAQNKKCWGCHDSSGSEPLLNMGSRYNNSYKCFDCHNATSKPYANVSNARNVSEHFKSGFDIPAGAGAIDNSSSCVICHNLQEMRVTYIENDIFNSNYSLASHYGRNRTSDLQLRKGIGTNCSYCHQNASTVFKIAMTEPGNNSNVSNHNKYGANPDCTSAQCHNSGMIHNETLTAPLFTLPNSTYCLGCHGNNGAGATNYSGSVTGYKEKHNNTVDCTDCHFNTSKDIHPAKYLLANASYSTDNSSAVNCISCHQNSTVYPGLSRTPPKIPVPMRHSDNASNGTRWNSTGYWTPNDAITSCLYCHNNTDHKASALGRPAEWKGDNIVNSSITNTSNWCASCHLQIYVSGGKTYTLTASAFISSNLSVPPEITNGSYAPYDIPGYYNHSFSDFNDSTCKVCHGKSLASNARMDDFMHNLTVPSCLDCHYSYEYMNGSSVNMPEKFVNQSMYNSSAHGSLVCEDCHTKGHDNIGARKACEDCHAYQLDPINDRDRHNITGIPAQDVVNNTDCTSCHNAGLYTNATSQYGYGKTYDCNYCHTYPDKTYS